MEDAEHEQDGAVCIGAGLDGDRSACGCEACQEAEAALFGVVS